MIKEKLKRYVDIKTLNDISDDQDKNMAWLNVVWKKNPWIMHQLKLKRKRV